MNNEELLVYVDNLAVEQIKIWGQPNEFNYQTAIINAERLAKHYGADPTLAKIGTMLMDIKIGECMNKGKPETHVAESLKYSDEILSKVNIDSKLKAFLLDLVRYHHGTDKYPSKEAEIVANADCYRFLLKEGTYKLILNTGEWGWDMEKSKQYVLSKLEEKYKTLSLDMAKQELEPLYHETINWLKFNS